jgi:tripeptide aminopeptidase
MTIDTERLIRLFLDLAVVDAVSFRETPVAKFIREYIDDASVTCITAGRPPSGDCDNLICIPDGVDRSKPVTLLCAHMDTVRPTAELHPIIEGDFIKTDGSTILGADNRAGIAALLYTLKDISERSIQAENVAFVFTVAEETGILGSKHLDLSTFQSVEHAFVFDCSRRPGIFIQHCHGCVGFNVAITGKAAHAGVNPEAGINAIAIASEIITRIPQGKLPDDATCNIGIISGGEATNVVSPAVRFIGEVRGPSTEVIDRHLTALRHIATKIAEQRGGSCNIVTTESFTPFYIEPSSSVFRQAEKILSLAGLVPRPIRYSGGSDANVFNARGIPSINFGIGAQKPHSTDEFIFIEDLVKTAEIARRIATGTQAE